MGQAWRLVHKNQNLSGSERARRGSLGAALLDGGGWKQELSKIPVEPLSPGSHRPGQACESLGLIPAETPGPPRPPGSGWESCVLPSTAPTPRCVAKGDHGEGQSQGPRGRQARLPQSRKGRGRGPGQGAADGRLLRVPWSPLFTAAISQCEPHERE